MKAFAFRTALALALVAAAVVPAAAAPWCADYCDCDSNCWTQCYDEGGSSACTFYLCRGQWPCGPQTAADNPADALLRAITAPSGDAAASSDPQRAAACPAAAEITFAAVVR